MLVYILGIIKRGNKGIANRRQGFQIGVGIANRWRTIITACVFSFKKFKYQFYYLIYTFSNHRKSFTSDFALDLNYFKSYSFRIK